MVIKMKKKYYEAYDGRYKVMHEKGCRWSSDIPTPIVLQTIKKYNISHKLDILELGCGEGRDSYPVLKEGYNLFATDISPQVIKYCKNKYNQFFNNFAVFDFLNSNTDKKYHFIFSVAVIHMLILDKDRNKYFSFIREHLLDTGLALICSMGDGKIEMQTDINKAFDIVERKHKIGKVLVNSTSCRMVSFNYFENEIKKNGLSIVEKGITESLPDFDSLMYVIVKK